MLALTLWQIHLLPDSVSARYAFAGAISLFAVGRIGALTYQNVEKTVDRQIQVLSA